MQCNLGEVCGCAGIIVLLAEGPVAATDLPPESHKRGLLPAGFTPVLVLAVVVAVAVLVVLRSVRFL